jgi:predicted nucleic acid-binding protein
MLVLDTNIVSEPLAKEPNSDVLDWLRKNAADAYVTTISMGELYQGARMLPHGKRREGIIGAIDDIAIAFQDHILPYDLLSAKRYAVLQEESRVAGRTLTVEDGMILAICQTNSATLVTRNTRDFNYLTDRIINPWNQNQPENQSLK